MLSCRLRDLSPFRDLSPLVVVRCAFLGEGSITVSARVILSLVPLAVVLLIGTPAPAETALRPDEPGQYNVGTTTFSATMTGGRVTRVQVFYPTLEPASCGRKYIIQSAAGPYEVTSPLCAVENAPVAQGPFPLIVYDHGGPVAGADFQRVSQAPVHELLASHGFVVVVALHSADPAVRVLDLPLVIDIALARSSTVDDLLEGSVDPARIGISGLSAGGAAALSIAGGWSAKGIASDDRIKAMVVYEPSQTNTLADAGTISFPYLIMGGTQFRNSEIIPALFEATTGAVPRIHVRSPNAVHFNYVSSLCAFTAETREAALVNDPSLPEPLTNFVGGNPYAITAYTNWNMGEAQFPANGYGFGGARNICNRIGVDSVRSLDVDPADGFTDSPPFLATDAFTLAPAIPGEVMVPVVKLYTVAFWKTFLAGDHQYMRYLAPGYARANDLPAEVTIRG
jgi:acetyl esterase/lipase